MWVWVWVSSLPAWFEAAMNQLSDWGGRGGGVESAQAALSESEKNELASVQSASRGGIAA